MSTRRITKWDRPAGRKEISDRLPSVPGGGANRCEWHRSGKPLWWSGAFFETGCPECQAKLAAGKTTADAPTPEQAFALFKETKRKAGQRAAVALRQRQARAAMTKQFHETLPGRECA
jgi:hypothetical protein